MATTSSPASARIRPRRPQQHRVLGDHDPHGSSTEIVVGPPGGLITYIVPPSPATRSCNPAGPVPRGPRHRRCRRRGPRPRGGRRPGDVDVGPGRHGVAGDVGEGLVDDEVGSSRRRGGRSATWTSRSPGSAIGRRPPRARRRARGPRGSPGGCRGRGRGSPRSADFASSWATATIVRPSAICRASSSPRRAQVGRQRDEALLGPSWRSRSMRRRSASALSTAAVRLVSSRVTWAASSSSALGPSSARARPLDPADADGHPRSDEQQADHPGDAASTAPPSAVTSKK